MLFTSLIALTGLSLVAAAPAAAPHRARAVGTWSLYNYVRVCDDAQNSCTYSFTVHDNDSGREDVCNFVDQGDASRVARWSSSAEHDCSEGSPIYVNIGYDEAGSFFVIVPVNKETNLDAFFGYSVEEMADGNVTAERTADSFVVGTYESAKVGAAVTARDGLGLWTVESLHRTCQTGAESSCSYTFLINQNDGSQSVTCALSIPGQPTQSFYAVPCQDRPEWVISWAYNSEYGYAVMTVVNQPKQLDAWFGFDDINNVTDFPNIGPNTVYSM